MSDLLTKKNAYSHTQTRILGFAASMAERERFVRPIMYDFTVEEPTSVQQLRWLTAWVKLLKLNANNHGQCDIAANIILLEFEKWWIQSKQNGANQDGSSAHLFWRPLHASGLTMAVLELASDENLLRGFVEGSSRHKVCTDLLTVSKI